MNEVIDFPKIKKPKGKIKIELFDDLTGKKIEEVHSTNFISRGVEYAYKLMMLGLFTRNRLTGGIDTSSMVSDLFSEMLLTTADHPEDPIHEWLPKGKIIGKASTTSTYTGSDKFLGSYNQSESYTNAEKVHIVVDFPTHASNGTFNSIYFKNERDQAIKSSYYFIKDHDLYHLLERKYGDKWVVMTNSNRRVVIVDNDFNILSETDLVNVKHFDVVGDTLYYIKYYNENAIYKATLPTLNDEVQVASHEYKLSSIAYDSLRRRFYVYVDEYVDGGYNLLIYDNEFNLINAIKQSSKKRNALVIDGFLYTSNEYSSSSTSKYKYFYDMDSYESYRFEDNIGNKLNIIGHDSTKLFIKISDQDIGIIPKTYIGSRSLLDAPVTKTETNTMKITYDFILPPIF